MIKHSFTNGLEAADAFLYVRSEEPRYQAKKRGSEDRHRLVAAELGDPTHKMDTGDSLLAVVPQVIEDDEWPIGRTAEDRVVEVQGLDGCMDIISPGSRVDVALARLVGEAMTTEVHRDAVGSPWPGPS